jgi:cytochrome c-type biogenesis protein CcmH
MSSRMTNMLRSWLVLLAVLSLGSAVYAVDTTVMPTEPLQQRYSALTHELRCMQCQNQSIADSPVGLASDLRAQVRDQLIAGKSDSEIRNYMVARYGEFILFRPQFNGRTAWLWLAPGILLLIGAWVVWRVLRQRKLLLAQDVLNPVELDLNK